MERCHSRSHRSGSFWRGTQNVARPNAMRMGINSWGNVLGGKLSASSFDEDRKKPDNL